jgi:hypothetical protein
MPTHVLGTMRWENNDGVCWTNKIEEEEFIYGARNCRRWRRRCIKCGAKKAGNEAPVGADATVHQCRLCKDLFSQPPTLNT